MDAYKIIKKLIVDSGRTMQDVALELGITRQSCYKSLHGRISMDLFKSMVESCGYQIVIVDKSNHIVQRLK